MATKTFVGTQVSRVINDDMLPHAVLDGTINALFKDGDINEFVLEELVHSIGVRAERMYAWAEAGNYVHGLPSGQYTNPAGEVSDAVDAVLESIEGAPVTIDYLQWAPPNSLHIGWLKLIADHGYDPATNQLAALSATKGTTVWLDDMRVSVGSDLLAQIAPRSLEQWGMAACAGYTPERSTGTDETRRLVAPSPLLVDGIGTGEYLQVTYVWQSGGVLSRDSFTIAVSGYEDQKNYFQARYIVAGVVKYWIYEDGAGTYPLLDVIYDRPIGSGGNFFPFIYFRHGKASISADPTSETYLDCKKLAKYIGMDYDAVAEQIDTNPDITDVEQAVLMFAVPASTTDPLERRYLWTFFNNLFLSQPEASRYRSDTAASLAQDVLDHPVYFGATVAPSIVIRDTRFSMAIQLDNIYKRRVAGSIGAVGSYDSGVSEEIGTTTAQDHDGNTVPIDVAVKFHYFRRQVSKGFYDEIRCANLRTLFHVFDGYDVIGDADDAILVIPLDHSITSTYTMTEREALYARGMHLVFNSRVVVKLEWYQTEVFEIFLIIVAVAMIIWSGGSGMQAAIALMEAGLYTAAAMAIITMVLEYVLFQLAFKLFVKLVGVDLAFLVAIVAAAMGVVGAVEAGGIGGAPMAQELLSVANGLVGAINKKVQVDMEDLLHEGQAFESYKKDQLKLLDSAQDLLKQDIHLNPFVIFGESPNDFYNRTVHSGNIGVVGIDAVSAFVESKLTLPKLTDTLGGVEYA